MKQINTNSTFDRGIEYIINMQREEQDCLAWEVYNEIYLKDFQNYIHEIFANKDIPFPDFASASIGENIIEVGWVKHDGVQMSLDINIINREISFYTIQNPGNNIVEDINLNFEHFIDNEFNSLWEYFQRTICDNKITTFKTKNRSLV